VYKRIFTEEVYNCSIVKDNLRDDMTEKVIMIAKSLGKEGDDFFFGEEGKSLIMFFGKNKGKFQKEMQKLKIPTTNQAIDID